MLALKDAFPHAVDLDIDGRRIRFRMTYDKKR
jgi:hypothetical protein